MLTRNSLAHLLARLLSLAAGLATISLVGVSLGNEALGLFGLQMSYQAMLGLFDLGMPTAANFRLAVLHGRGASWTSQATFIRSLEILFWLLAVVFFFVGAALTDPLTRSWLNIQDLPPQLVAQAILLISAGVAVRFPIAFYTNVCFGLNRHVFPNFVVSAAAGLRVAAGAVALFVLHVNVVGFFWVQLLAGIMEVGALAIGVWWGRGGWRVRPTLQDLRQVAGHSSILSGISITGAGLAQVDKVILSNLLPLGDFGLYSAAYALASGLLALSYPIGNAIFPSLSQSFDHGDKDRVRSLVRSASEMVLLLIVPAGAAVVTQSQSVADLLFLLRGTPSALAELLPLMVLGGMFQAYITIPHFCQIAAHRAVTVLWINLVTLPLYTGLTYLAASRWGVQGGALSFLVMNAFRLPVHWWFLPSIVSEETERWKLAVTVLGITAMGLAAAFLAGRIDGSMLTRMVLFLGTIIILTGMTAMILPGIRGRLRVRLTGADR